MGIDLVYFSAADDAAAAQALHRPGGPLGWRELTGMRKVGLFRKEPVFTEALGPAFDGFATRGYDPTVRLGTLEELLTGRPYDLVIEDPRSGAAVGDEELDDRDVLTLTDALTSALVEADDARLREVVGPWSRTEELQQPGSGSTATQPSECAERTRVMHLSVRTGSFLRR